MKENAKDCVVAITVEVSVVVRNAKSRAEAVETAKGMCSNMFSRFPEEIKEYISDTYVTELETEDDVHRAEWSSDWVTQARHQHS